MPAEGRGPDLRQARKVMRSRGLANGPATPLESVQKLQTSLQAKAKAEPDFRFYSLWDKVCRADVLEEAYRACRRNDGAPGCDGMTFNQITAYGAGSMAGRVAAGAAGWRLSATAPAARVDTKEQRRPAPARHPVHPRPRGRDGGAAGAGADLRGGPAAQSVRLPSGDGRQDGGSPSLLAR